MLSASVRVLSGSGALLKKNGDSPGGRAVKALCYPAGDTGAIPGQGTKIPHAMWCGLVKKMKKTE